MLDTRTNFLPLQSMSYGCVLLALGCPVKRLFVLGYFAYILCGYKCYHLETPPFWKYPTCLLVHLVSKSSRNRGRVLALFSLIRPVRSTSVGFDDTVFLETPSCWVNFCIRSDFWGDASNAETKVLNSARLVGLIDGWASSVIRELVLDRSSSLSIFFLSFRNKHSTDMCAWDSICSRLYSKCHHFQPSLAEL